MEDTEQFDDTEPFLVVIPILDGKTAFNWLFTTKALDTDDAIDRVSALIRDQPRFAKVCWALDIDRAAIKGDRPLTDLGYKIGVGFVTSMSDESYLEGVEEYDLSGADDEDEVVATS